MGKKTILEVRVKDVQKRRHPSKHYVYAIEVSWSEGSSTTIYRRYSDFFEFQCELLERFPEESGARDPANRMIPFLPGKKLIGRSQVRSVAQKRKEKIDEYCRALIRLPTKISDDDFVIDFFEVRPEDINPSEKTRKSSKEKVSTISDISEPMLLERYVAIADYEKQKKNECSLRAGQTVEVIDKNQNGWWFVNVDDFNEGWVPATFLESLYGREESSVEVLEPGEEETFITCNKYTAQHEDEISFERGVLVEVFEKGLDGWWKIRYQGQEGLAPAAYLRKYHGTGVAGGASAPAELVSSVREAVQSASGSSKESKMAPSRAGGGATASIARQQFQPTFHSLPQPYVDKEPIYAPTPRRHSIKRAPLIKRMPKPAARSPPSSPTSDTDMDHPEPVYEIIPEIIEEIYVTIADFNAARAGDGLSFQAGVSVSVITKNPTGWWFVEMGDNEGWVPSSYLERKEPKKTSPVHTSPSDTKAPPFPVRTRPPEKNVKTTSSKHLSSKSTGNISQPTVPQVRKTPLKRSSSTENILSSVARPTIQRSRSPPPATTKRSPPSPRPATRTTSRQPTGRKGSSPGENTKSPYPWKTLRQGSAEELGSMSAPKPSPVPRKTTLSRAVSSDTSRQKPAARLAATKSNLELPSHNVRVSSFGSRPVRGGGGDAPDSGPKRPVRGGGGDAPDSGPKHQLELERVLQHRSATIQPGGGAKRGPPQRPKLPTAATLGARKVPPKRPEPPKNPGAKKAPPPRPGNSPALKRRSSYMTICDYAGDTDSCLSFNDGEKVEVLEKSSDGWWYIKIGAREGWAPASFIEESSAGKPKPPRPSQGPALKQNKAPVPKPRPRTRNPNLYRAVASYQVPPYEDSGVPLVEGRQYEVLEKNESGWWYVKDGDSEGWVPESYLDPA